MGFYAIRSRAKVAAYGVPCQNRPTLKAEIFTSADADGKFGCADRAVNELPLAIYAKVFADDGNMSSPVPIFLDGPQNSSGGGTDAGQPSMSTISAHLLHLQTGTSITTALRDDGLAGDLVGRDGLYSGYVYPHLKGGWRLYITVYDMTGEFLAQIFTELIHSVYIKYRKLLLYVTGLCIYLSVLLCM